MYVPRPESYTPSLYTTPSQPDPPAGHAAPPNAALFPGPPPATLPLVVALRGRSRNADHGQQSPNLTKRGQADTNTTIGIIVGVLLGVFLIATCAFLWRYRYTVRFSYRKKHRRRRKSGGSKSSKSSAGSAPASPAASAPQPPAAAK